LVYVADREADILGLMQCAHQLGTPADWLIRSQHNRCLPDGGKLWATILAAAPLGGIEFDDAGASRTSRPAGSTSGFCQQNQFAGWPGWPVVGDLPDRQEINAPANCKPVEWRLLTNRAAECLEAVIELIDWYRCRWEIETFFHVLEERLPG
jgi:hypothetical protein